MGDYIIRDVPPELWRAFKSAAATKGETMRAALLRFLAEYAGQPPAATGRTGGRPRKAKE